MFKTIAPAAFIAVLATGAHASQTISEIDVSVDLPAIENKEAAAVWTSLGTDLETAIADRKSTRLKLQSLTNLVCRLLLEKKKKKNTKKNKKKKQKKQNKIMNQYTTGTATRLNKS